jgi:hypothetical protein
VSESASALTRATVAAPPAYDRGVDDRVPAHDPERVVALRRTALLRAGYTEEQADTLARRAEVDLQAALAPRRQGLPPDVAFELVLGGGGRTVF